MNNTASMFATSAILALTTSVAMGDVVAHWQCDEKPGATTATDNVGSVDGALVGDAAFVTDGVNGNAMHMTRAGNGHANFGDVFPMTSTDFSIATWVKTDPGDTTNETFVIARHRSGIAAGYFLGLNNSGPYGGPGKAYFYQSTSPGGEVTSSSTINDGQWHLIVISYHNGGSADMYVDGAPVDATGSSSNIPLAPADFAIGAIQYGGTLQGQFTGWVDEVQIYDHALRPCDAQFLFDNPGAVAQPPAPCPSDLNNNGIVDVPDLLVLLSSWGDPGGVADINCDLIVDVVDLITLLGEFGPC